MLFVSYPAFLPYLKSGEVRLIAVGQSIRGSSTQPFDEAGYPVSKYSRVNGFFISAKTPTPIYEKLVAAFRQVVTNPELTKKWEGLGLVPGYQDPKEFGIFLKDKARAVSVLVDELGLNKK